MPLPSGTDFSDNSTSNVGLTGEDSDFVSSIITNQNNAGFSSNLPPKQQGQYSLVAPSGVQILNTMYSTFGQLFTIGWQDVQSNNQPIAGYRVYSQLAYNNNQQPTLVGQSAVSPCVVRIIASQEGIVTFWVQPYLQNGITLPLIVCPTVSGSVPNPIFSFNFSSTGDVFLISDNVYVGGSATQTGWEIYNQTDGITGEHTSASVGIIEVDASTGGGIGYTKMVTTGLAGTLSQADGALTFLLDIDNTPVSGRYYGELQLGFSSAGTGPTSSAQLLAKTGTLNLKDGTTGHDVTYTAVPVAAPIGPIINGLKITIAGTDYTIPLY